MSTAKVWSRFTAKKPDGTIIKLRIQELTKDQHEELFEFHEKYFLPAESFQRGSGIYKNEHAKKEFKYIYNNLLNSPNMHSVVCCPDEGSDPQPILGFSGMALEAEKNERDLKELLSQIQTPEVKKLLFMLLKTEELCSAKEKFGFSKYYSGRGIVVHPDFRGLGIATELVKGRRIISKEHGAEATGAWMTSLGTQKAADYDKWETVFQMPFKDFGQIVDVDFDIAPPILKMMVARVDE